jgi:Xaa-Pro aminopeptidase
MNQVRQINRLEKYRQALKEQNLSGFLVTREVNVRYLSGFTGDSAWLLVTDDQGFLLTDSRYVEQARQQTVGFSIIEIKQSLIQTAVDLALEAECLILGIDSDHLSVSQYQLLLKTAAKKIELRPETDSCGSLRQIKDVEEIIWLKKAASLGDQALEALQPLIRPGVTEKHLSRRLAYLMDDLGSEGLSFGTIVASGWRGALPHGEATEKKLELGEMVTFDFGCILGGYHSDMTRTFILGQPNQKQSQLYSLVLEAQEAAIAKIEPGMSNREIDRIARDHIRNAGFGDYFGHGLGHSVGLEIHEDPRFSPSSPEVNLESGMLLTVEPGIYLPAWGGLRIEDMVLITPNGHEILTKFPKTLVDMTII